MLLDFEKMDGFVIDLSTRESAKEWFMGCFTMEQDEHYGDFTLEEIRDIVVEYYTNISGCYYVIAIESNVYFIIEKELLDYKGSRFYINGNEIGSWGYDSQAQEIYLYTKNDITYTRALSKYEYSNLYDSVGVSGIWDKLKELYGD